MDTLIVNGSVITGDGRTMHDRASIRIRDDKILAVTIGGESEELFEDITHVVDAKGCTVIPGVINGHAHGCMHGPTMPSGSTPQNEDDIEYFRNRHLLEGTTTLLNVCGLAFPQEVDLNADMAHPLDVQATTAHTPSNLGAALKVDGKGLSEKHRNANVDQMIAAGAKALGEVGGGQTLGGGAQEYKFIPEAMKREAGVDMSPVAARALKKAVLGTYLDEADAKSDEEIDQILDDHGLGGEITPTKTRDIIRGSVMPSMSLALDGFDEIAAESQRTQYPAVFHNATPTAKTLVKLAEKYPNAIMVAGHSNHSMFSIDQCVHYATELKDRGVNIDVSTLDCIETQWRNNPDNIDALVESGLVDTISTDFAGSHWDGILKAIHRIVNRKQLSAPAAVALATGNVAKIFPQLAGDRGLIERGKRADLVIVDQHNLSRVKHVFIKGKRVVCNGALVRADKTGAA